MSNPEYVPTSQRSKETPRKEKALLARAFGVGARGSEPLTSSASGNAEHPALPPPMGEHASERETGVTPSPGSDKVRQGSCGLLRPLRLVGVRVGSGGFRLRLLLRHDARNALSSHSKHALIATVGLPTELGRRPLPGAAFHVFFLGTISFAMTARMAHTPTTHTMPMMIELTPSITTLLPAP